MRQLLCMLSIKKAKFSFESTGIWELWAFGSFYCPQTEYFLVVVPGNDAVSSPSGLSTLRLSSVGARNWHTSHLDNSANALSPTGKVCMAFVCRKYMLSSMLHQPLIVPSVVLQFVVVTSHDTWAKIFVKSWQAWQECDWIQFRVLCFQQFLHRLTSLCHFSLVKHAWCIFLYLCDTPLSINNERALCHASLSRIC